MHEYNPKKIESKWQQEWKKSGIYQAEDSSRKPKYYALIEFPYPSGDGLHVGHPRPYIGLDVISRKRRMEGYNVLYPIGWDAFGLPTENYAIKTGKNPRQVTKENTNTFRRQIQSLGISFDWSREINTTDPKYYKWTQWIFLKFLEKGLAYKAKVAINWCPSCKIGLANEEVLTHSTSSGQAAVCERCGTPVEQKEKEQWMLAITKYADKLLSGLDEVDYPERVKVQQRNWIGKSEGALIKFDDVEVFTTRPDTIFGATFVVVAGKEDKFTGRYVTNPATNEEIPIWEAEYVYGDYGTGAIMAVPAHDERDYEFAKKHDLPIRHVIIPKLTDPSNPHQEGKETIFRNAVIVIVRNPKTNEILTLKWKKLPWTTFVMGGIEEGETPEEAAIREIKEETGYKNVKIIKLLGGPVHNEFFATHKDENRIAHTQGVLAELIDEERDEVSEEEKYKYELVWIPDSEIAPEELKHTEAGELLNRINLDSAYTGEGILINSDGFDGLESEEAREKITEKFGKKVIKYKLRDWIFSRQRYWGEPIPVVHCDECGIVPIPEKDLPVTLPEVENYQPTDTGESPLVNITDWVNTTCPKCGGEAKRETDVMPNWAGSSWYFLRYTDPENDQALADKKKLEYWIPVDWYNGGMEHTVLHLLYSRFWNKFLYDIGVVPVDEPYKKRTSHGLILAEGGEKMSKSKGNVINPDSIVERFGADTLRLYEMFMGPFEQAIEWNDSSLAGPRRFLERVWRLRGRTSNADSRGPTSGSEVLIHSTIKKVSEDIEALGFNTAVSTLMIFANDLEKREKISKEEYETLLKLLAPFAPHIMEELWRELGHLDSIHKEKWPEYDETKLVSENVTIVVQVNGKVRGSLTAPRDVEESAAVKNALDLPEIKKWLGDKNVEKSIYVPRKLVNIVVS
ncbi:MAG: class I tRNA ligase family protein [Candidatus Zambryskibacteria bacterium]|nr:class I tRNA ligase family protein [Candidatus Zambryskibacteria bacterium]